MSETHGNPSDTQEPKTPMWLTALGAVLFLTAGVIWGLMPASKNEAGNAPNGAGSAAADAGAPAAH